MITAVLGGRGHKMYHIPAETAQKWAVFHVFRPNLGEKEQMKAISRSFNLILDTFLQIF